MTTETIAAPGAAAETAPDVKVETPEVTTPDADESAKQQPEADPIKALEQRLEKERARMERRIDRKHAEAAQAKERVRYLEEQLQRAQTQQPQEGEQTQQRQASPDDIDRMADQRAQEIVQARELQKRVGSILEQGKAIPDFDRLCNDLNAEIAFYDKGKPSAFLEAVMDSDKPHALLAHLGQNPDIAEELNGLSPAQLGRRLARIEADLTAKPEGPKPSKAPKPLEPVKGSATTGEPNPKDTAAWIAWRNKQTTRR